MIRIVLAVVISAALLGIALPSAERADRDRNTALAIDELERTAHTADRLAAENDPVPATEKPAATTIELTPPDPAFTEAGGYFRIDDDELLWEVSTEVSRTVSSTVPIRVEDPLVITERTRLRLRFVRLDEKSVVQIRLENDR